MVSCVMDWMQLHKLYAGGECVLVCLWHGTVVGVGVILGDGCNTLGCVVTGSFSLSLESLL